MEKKKMMMKKVNGMAYKNECIKRENKRYRDMIIDTNIKKNTVKSKVRTRGTQTGVA